MALCTHYCDYQLLIWMHHSAGFSCQLSRLLRRRTIKLVGPLYCRVRYKLYIQYCGVLLKAAKPDVLSIQLFSNYNYTFTIL